ncbi:MAG: hypothetical protein JXA94_01430 [Parachlamydiales bacterium]|nr:hypothetical protein [Parachlamydiales bacterium]
MNGIQRVYIPQEHVKEFDLAIKGSDKEVGIFEKDDGKVFFVSKVFIHSDFYGPYQITHVCSFPPEIRSVTSSTQLFVDFSHNPPKIFKKPSSCSIL